MKIWRFCLALCAFFPCTGSAAFIDGVNLGGGFMWNDSVRLKFASAGGITLHASVHLKPPGPFILTPFYDVSFASPAMHVLGAGLNYTVGMRDFEAHKLFVGPIIGRVISAGESQGFIGGELGYKFPIGEKLGLFARVKYLEDQNDMVSGFSGHLGATFKLFP